MDWRRAIGNSIVSANTQGVAGADIDGNALTDNNFNFVGTAITVTNFNKSGDTKDNTPGLGALNYYGGPTMAFAVLTTSTGIYQAGGAVTKTVGAAAIGDTVEIDELGERMLRGMSRPVAVVNLRALRS